MQVSASGLVCIGCRTQKFRVSISLIGFRLFHSLCFILENFFFRVTSYLFYVVYIVKEIVICSEFDISVSAGYCTGI